MIVIVIVFVCFWFGLECMHWVFPPSIYVILTCFGWCLRSGLCSVL